MADDDRWLNDGHVSDEQLVQDAMDMLLRALGNERVESFIVPEVEAMRDRIESELNGEISFSSKTIMGGENATVMFPNGYGASIIRTIKSYGHEKGLLELGVLAGTTEENYLTYTTPITNDVIGSLDEDQVWDLLVEISKLNPNN